MIFLFVVLPASSTPDVIHPGCINVGLFPAQSLALKNPDHIFLSEVLCLLHTHYFLEGEYIGLVSKLLVIHAQSITQLNGRYKSSSVQLNPRLSSLRVSGGNRP